MDYLNVERRDSIWEAAEINKVSRKENPAVDVSRKETHAKRSSLRAVVPYKERKPCIHKEYRAFLHIFVTRGRCAGCMPRGSSNCIQVNDEKPTSDIRANDDRYKTSLPLLLTKPVYTSILPFCGTAECKILVNQVLVPSVQPMYACLFTKRTPSLKMRKS